MSFYYIKGTPGSGKTTVRKELERLGYEAHDADDDDMGGPHNKLTNQRVTYPNKPSEQWYQEHCYRLMPEAVRRLKKKAANKTIFLSGTASNEDEVWDLFDDVLFLSIDLETLKSRILNRTNNDYGQQPHEMEEIIQKYHADQEKCQRLSLTRIDATMPIQDVIKEIINRAESSKK